MHLLDANGTAYVHIPNPVISNKRACLHDGRQLRGSGDQPPRHGDVERRARREQERYLQDGWARGSLHAFAALGVTAAPHSVQTGLWPMGYPHCAQRPRRLWIIRRSANGPQHSIHNTPA